MSNPLPFYKLKYDTADLHKVLYQITKPEHLGNLFFINQKLIESDPELKQAFAVKRDLLKENARQELLA